MTLGEIDIVISGHMTKKLADHGVRKTQLSSEQHNTMYTGIASAMQIQLLQEISAKLDRNQEDKWELMSTEDLKEAADSMRYAKVKGEAMCSVRDNEGKQ
jgi:hypothetical protein